ncbi:uncharacterized protein ACNS7B_019397 [Menidia menidia]
MMDDAGDPTDKTFGSDNVATMKENSHGTQVMTLKANVSRIIRVMQAVAQKSFVKTCQLLCLPLGSQPSRFSALIPRSREDKNTEALHADFPQAETLKNTPSTIMIINISNSTLVDCVIGDSNSTVVTERRPLLQEFDPQSHAQVRCCCRQDQHFDTPVAHPPPTSAYAQLPSEEHLNICIQSSNLSYAIIGDNNHLHAEHGRPFD